MVTMGSKKEYKELVEQINRWNCTKLFYKEI